MEINEYLLKITGAASIPEKIDIDKTAQVNVPVEIYSVEKLNNQDGTFNIKYRGKINGEAIITQGDKIIKSKDKTKASRRLRFAIEKLASGDSEEFYQKTMNKLIANLEDVITFLDNSFYN